MLRNYKPNKISIENIKAEIELIKAEDGMRGITYDGIVVDGTNKNNSPTENIALSNIDRVKMLELDIYRLELEIVKIDRALPILTETERVIVVNRYIEGLQWWQVTSMVCYGERQCRNIEDDAFKKLALIYY